MSAGSGTENFLWAFAVDQGNPYVYKLNSADLTVIASAQVFNNQPAPATGNYWYLRQDAGTKNSAAGPDGSLFVVAENQYDNKLYLARIYPDFSYQLIFLDSNTSSNRRPGLVTSDLFLWARASVPASYLYRWRIDNPFDTIDLNTAYQHATEFGAFAQPQGVRHMSYLEQYDTIIYGGVNGSGTGIRLYSIFNASYPINPSTPSQISNVTTNDGGWQRGAVIPKVDQGPVHAINSSAMLFINNQYNGDIYYRLNIGSDGSLSGFTGQFQTNVYQYGGTQYLANVRVLDGSTLKQGYGIGFSYYTNGNYNVVFDSSGIAQTIWNYADYNAAVAPQNFNNGTVNSCANPINQLFYTASHIGNGQGADIIAWEIDPISSGTPRFVARTAQLWQNNGPYRTMGICHSTPDTHQQKFTPLPT